MTQPIAQVIVYFSFGHGQTDPTTGKHLLDHYVTIVGPSYEACRAAMFASKYGDRWAFDYIAGEPQAEQWIPRWIEHERIVLPADAQGDPACSPECEAQDADRPHLFDCPVRRAAETS
ncbi:hypothetical protein Ait01nite_031680 [Actinoplanes italicus]|uniref:Uncharacterized protein n=1 Tax=Actinoplanes italicus TaxID=113567 RepID=A0A2T0KJC6_9ACTN|nr:hypothetical protein [Actinoplanes italicus]PRX23623.1 hypothetical protein CLV67_103372 [Actinoplanes italicus]GIE30123.1 hypothetical protein Ait01nite_031680 [Actinoplanes italicus]